MDARKLGCALVTAVISFVLLAVGVYIGSVVVLVELYDTKCYTTDCNTLRGLMVFLNDNTIPTALLGAVLVAGLVLVFSEEGVLVIRWLKDKMNIGFG